MLKNPHYLYGPTNVVVPVHLNVGEHIIEKCMEQRNIVAFVALIFGTKGACRRQELANITTNDIENHRRVLLVQVKNTKNKIPRSFTIQGPFYDVVKKYEALRSTKANSKRFFQNYQNGKCTKQPIGINKFGAMPKEIATFLNLPEAHEYTGHSFRRSSATLLADSGADLLTLKRHGGWRSSSVAEGYIDDSMRNKEEISSRITKNIHLESSVNFQPSTSTHAYIPPSSPQPQPPPPPPPPPTTAELCGLVSPTFTQESERETGTNALTKEALTYGELAQQSMNLTISLSRLGVRKGQVLAICSENRLEFFPAVIATLCTGAIITPINAGYTKDELLHVLNISKPKFIFCSPVAYETVRRTSKSLRFIKKIILFGDERKDGALLYNDLAIMKNDNDIPDNITKVLSRNIKFEEFRVIDVQGQTDLAVILYSSGTTGLPKGVMLTHYNVISLCGIAMPHSGQLRLLITPWYHAMGFLGTIMTLTSLEPCIYLAKFELKVYMETIEKYKISRLSVAPPILIAICKSSLQYDLSCVEYVASGAAPLREDITKEAMKKFPKATILQGYGLSECMIVTKDFNFDFVKSGSVGTVAPGSVVKVVDLKTRKPLGPNQHGEICVNSPILMKGYIGKDRSEDFDDEDFYRTGDIGYYDEDKYFFIVDRLKELIKYKGYQVAPAEIEDVLLQHEDIVDAGVVGVPSSTAGEVPLAFVVVRPGTNVSASDVKDFVAQKLSNPKHLRGGVRFVDTIPRNPSGKILRRLLKDMIKPKKSKL